MTNIATENVIPPTLQTTRGPLHWLLALLAASPAIAPLWVILKYGVDLPYWDEWEPDILGLVIDARLHRLHPGDFLALHNEHRLVLTRLIYLGINLLFHGNNVAVQMGTWVMVCFTSIGILGLCCFESTGRFVLSYRALAFWFVCNLILFNLVQVETWLWGMCLMNVTPMMFIVPAMFVAISGVRASAKLAIAMIMATAATFSSGNGMLAWPMVGVLLAWSFEKQQFEFRWRMLAVWIFGFGVNIMFYFRHYVSPVNVPTGARAESISQALFYIPVFLGNIFSIIPGDRPISSAMIGGCCLLTLYLAVSFYFLFMLRRGSSNPRLNAMLIWITIGGFSVVSAILAAKSRAGFGLQQALETRYVSFSLYIVVSLVNLVPLVCDDVAHRKNTGLSVNRFWNRVPAIVGIIPLVFFLMSQRNAITRSEINASKQRQAKAALLLMHVLPDDPWLSEVSYPPLSRVRGLADGLDAVGYLNPRLLRRADVLEIAESNSVAAGDVAGDIDQLFQDSQARVTVAGWAFRNDRNRNIDAVLITCEEGGHQMIVAQGSVDSRREDLAERNPDYLWSGWSAQISVGAMQKLSPGKNEILLSAWALDVSRGKARRFGKTITLTIAR